MHTSTKSTQDFAAIIDNWVKELDRYSFDQLLAKPSPTSWSMGQLYMHLLEATDYFIGQVNIAASNDENKSGESSAGARTMFLNDDFPDALLEGPPSNAITPQPLSKEQLIDGMDKLKLGINKMKAQILQSTFNGKTRHFGLGYFTAQEWLQFAEMHLRHHLRQKQRLDFFLKNTHIS